MGTDIHIRVERRASASSPWEVVKPVDQPCAYCYGEGKYKNGHECYGCKGAGKVNDWPTPRAYIAFAVLANVRNGFGFAGIPTHDAIRPISEPKGLPDDMASPEEPPFDGDDYKKAHEMGLAWLGDHSHSWLTLQEILDFKWTKNLRAQIEASGYGDFLFRELPKYGEPENVRIIFGFDS